MSPSTRRVDQILSETPSTASLLARLAAGRQAAAIIAPVCAQVAPGFDPRHAGACDLYERVLRLWLGSSAQSSKLRQALPTLTACLQGHGVEVNEIRLGIQARRVRENTSARTSNKAATAPTSGKNQNPKDDTGKILLAMDFAQKLALTLADSPLRRAVWRLHCALEARLATSGVASQPARANPPAGM